VWYLALFFVMAAAADTLSVLWQNARERDAILALGGLSMALEALGWLPLWFALMRQDMGIAIVSIAGSGVGAVLGAWQVRRSQRRAKLFE